MHDSNSGHVLCLGRRYAYSFMPDEKGEKKILAKGGNTGDVIYDFFIGRYTLLQKQMSFMFVG